MDQYKQNIRHIRRLIIEFDQFDNNVWNYSKSKKDRKELSVTSKYLEDIEEINKESNSLIDFKFRIRFFEKYTSKRQRMRFPMNTRELQIINMDSSEIPDYVLDFQGPLENLAFINFQSKKYEFDMLDLIIT